MLTNVNSFVKADKKNLIFFTTYRPKLTDSIISFSTLNSVPGR